MLEASRSCCRQSASLRPHLSCSFLLSHTITWENGVVQNPRTANGGARRPLTGTEQKVSFALHESFLALLPTQTPSELSRVTATVAQILKKKKKSRAVSPHTSCVAETQRSVVNHCPRQEPGEQGAKEKEAAQVLASSPPASAAVRP